jgi:hypothetical protein
MNEHTKQALDFAAASTTIATMLQWLPPMAAALTVIWTAIRIYEWAKNAGRSSSNRRRRRVTRRKIK